MRALLPICWLAAVAAETAFADPAAVTVTLAQADKPAATLVIAKQPTRAAQFAAYELQWHLKQITGGDFSIVLDDQAVQGLAILVGDSQPVRALGIQPDQLEKQEYLIRIAPQALVLVGRDKDDRGGVQYDQTPNQQALDTWPGIFPNGTGDSPAATRSPKADGICYSACGVAKAASRAPATTRCTARRRDRCTRLSPQKRPRCARVQPDLDPCGGLRAVLGWKVTDIEEPCHDRAFRSVVV